MNTKKTNQTRRNRGYVFETSVVKKFNDSGWDSKRLGSPSTHLPDFDALDNFHKVVVAGEAKSTIGDYAYVPSDQIQRCIDWVNRLDVYQHKYVILAFKFGQTRKITKGKSESKKLRFFYKVWPHKKVAATKVRCSYDGNILMEKDGAMVPIQLEEFQF